jgi:hypothetical protein
MQLELKVPVSRHVFNFDLCSQYILQDFPILFVIIFLTLPQMKAIAAETVQLGVIGAESR